MEGRIDFTQPETKKRNSRIFVRNMISRRCRMIVQWELDKLNVPVSRVELGEVGLRRPLTEDEHEWRTGELRSLKR